MERWIINDLCVFCGNDVSDLGTQVCAECKLKLGAFNMGLFHSAKKCVRNGQWNNGEFRCGLCGRLIALAYKTENGIHIWKLPRYKKIKIPQNNISFILGNEDLDGVVSDS